MNQQPIYTQSQPIKPAKGYKVLKAVRTFLLIILVVGGAAYGVYLWQQNQTLTSSVDDKTKQIETLNKSLVTTTDKTTTISTNVIAIRELGISVTVPDSLKDLTYSYKSLPKEATDTSELVYFSTKKITDLNRDGMCSAYLDSPLGALEKKTGQFPDMSDAGSPPSLVKQFDNYYIAYYHPQSYCSDDAAQTATISSALETFVTATKSVQELKR